MRLNLLAVALFSVTGLAAKQVEIRKFRFNRHATASFERLVLEFGAKDSSVPEVKVTPTPSGKEFTISVERASLVGSIPESAINETYTPKSQWIGPISINSDTPKGGFSVRAFLKNPGAQLDAFWLEAPSRLIVDVFAKDSLRASVGREVLQGIAQSKSHHATRKIASVPEKKAKANSVICFPQSSQVKAKIGFQKYNGSNQVGLKVDAEGTADNGDAVVCYPATSRVNPTVTFYSDELRASRVTSSQTHAGLPILSPSHASLVPVPQAMTLIPSPVESKPMTAEDRLNAEADQALGTEHDTSFAMPAPKAAPVVEEKRKVASEGMLVPFQDNFNKNNPPPTLGKRLLPPGSVGSVVGGKEASVVSPKGLLPPAKH